MSFLGELFGYDLRGNDLMGYPQCRQDACVVCGVAANAHTPAMTAECMGKLYAAPRAPQEEPTK